MIDGLTLIVLTLACFRIAMLVAQDTIWAGTREKILFWTMVGPLWRKKLGELIECPYCVGVWAAFILVAMCGSADSIGEYLVSVLAVSGGQAFLVSLSDDG
jgi:hypothetical protein